jgi:hypothetical protein
MKSPSRSLRAIETLLAAGLVALAASSLAAAHGGASHLRGPVTEAERRAFDEARPAFERHCFRCHAKGGAKAKAKARAHLDMTAYPFGGHHAGEAGTAVRKVLGAGPEKGRATMPSDEPGATTGADLKAILAWADAFTAAHAAPGDADVK